MASPEHQELVAALTAVGTVLTPTTAPSSEELREMRQSEASADLVIPDGSTVVPCRYGTVDCFRLDVGQHRRTVIYFHGGGYVYTRAADALGAIAALARCCELQAMAPEYRRAPESPFPAAVDDAVAVYRALLAEGVSNTDIVMAGDSAGGGLALACLIASRRVGLPVPAAAIVFSPWTDLAVEGSSADTAADPVVNGTGLRMMAGVYLDGADPRDPLASPLYARDDDLASLPPLLVQVGTREALLDDSRRFVARATVAGARVTYIEHPDVVHMWMVMAPELPESRQAFAAAAQFLSSLNQSAGPA